MTSSIRPMSTFEVCVSHSRLEFFFKNFKFPELQIVWNMTAGKLGKFA